MSARTPVAIIGMGALFPGAGDLDTYWANIVGGVDSITEVPADGWDPGFYAPGGADKDRRSDRIHCRRGGFVDRTTEFDVARFGIMPSSVAGTEPDQLIALEVAHRSLEDAGGDGVLPSARERAGIVLGRGGYLTPGLARLDQRVRTAHQLVRTLSELAPQLSGGQLEQVRAAFTDRLGPEQPESAIGLVPNLAASRVANRLDLRGPAYTVDAACASSLIAVDHAVRELASGRCDVMLAGGVHHCHDITLWSVFNQLGALSPSERIRPLHRDADGVLIGEGTGVVVLKRLADAERDGDRIYAVVTGTGVASDGRSASLLAPDPGGQVRAVRQAWDAAGLDPRAADAIGLLEAHGTATTAGDKAELTTLTEVFGPAQGGERAAIGSVKSMIGHTMPAAGIAGLIKAALAVHHGVLPPTLHCDDPNPALDGTRFAPLARTRPWRDPESGAPRRAGVNAFGFGGINAHVVLEQPVTSTTKRAPRATAREPERVLRLAADSVEELAALLTGDDAAVLASGRDERVPGGGPVRLGIVDPTERRLKLARKAVARGVPWRGRSDVWFTPRPVLGTAGGRTVFVFPGLEAEFTPRVEELATRFQLPWDPGSAARVDDVGRHGAAVFQLGRLLDTSLRRLGVVPDAVAGHSVGEWTAMACGGIHTAPEVDAFLAGFDPDALRVPGVAFGVLGMPATRVLEELAGREDVVLSHDNAPNQSMICGPEDEVAALVSRFRGQGIICQVLPFRSGFHTPLLAPYLGPIRAAAERYSLNPATTPVWSATIAAPFPSEPDAVRELFVRHLLEPVRFRETVLALHDAGFRAFVQLGAGQLGSLIDDTLAGRDRLVVAAHSPARDSLAQLRRVVTALWTEGASPEAGPLLSRTAAEHGAVTARHASGRPGVQLDLSGALVSLPARMHGMVAPALRDSAAPATPAPAHDPLGAELSALLDDTASAARELIGARSLARRTPPVRPRHPAPARRPAGPPPPAGSPAPTVPQELRVDVAEMPYLLDHCFFWQRPGWPEEGDRWPVVPATTVITHLMRIAEQARPGTRAIAVHEVRLLKWIAAIPSVRVPVEVRDVAPDRVEVALTGYSRAVVELAPTYPAAPEIWPTDPATEREPDLRAAQLYSERWMFHGPRFQGVSELRAEADHYVRGVLTTPEAPGALLDNVGQLLGYWIMSKHDERTTVFPVGMDRIRFFGPDPAPGTRLTCAVRITEVTGSTLTADMQLSHEGRVWAEFTGWQDRRFDNDATMRAVDRFPGSNTLSAPRPGGWLLVHERWPDLATRELVMRSMLGRAERGVYEGLRPMVRRRWLLGRIAAKDAVRTLLWQEGHGDLYPAEIAVRNAASGRPEVSGEHGCDVGAGLVVSIAHCGEMGVAIARRSPCGIDLEEISDRPRGTAQASCGPAELALLDRLVATNNEGAAVWFTRFWAAKEAVAKRLGRGLQGRPADFAVVSATPERLRVETGGAHYDVECTEVSGGVREPDGRRFIVAWTADDKTTGDLE
ncbi:beta-ketoacyl synthase N-terminal-like domain-containing protein [Streptomyces sp. ITFR-6]|nr:beta-ketoacyl synthase N-terminal-like domain-containing protein [Streptomyces sp. ITFR-6]WNI32255.1 beta-ketoacyl synthase N-terminal-like domain-containing protein [Streptomyces sp. ITFR-6]